MDDRISTLPDFVICHILSFLPTKLSVATSVLSKRWKPLWRSVPTFDFDIDCDCNYRDSKKRYINRYFCRSIKTFLCSRDPLQSLQKFCLMSCSNDHDVGIPLFKQVRKLVSKVVVQQKLEHLQLCLSSTIGFPFVALSCQTLVVLQLEALVFKTFSSVDLPSLKILHLHEVYFLEQKFLADFLSGCPNLEDFEIYVDYSRSRCKRHASEAKFEKLQKLVRAVVVKDAIPLKVVSNVQFLRIESFDKVVAEINETSIPQFDNITRIEFGYDHPKTDRLEVFKVLEHCPKLQTLVIDQDPYELYGYYTPDLHLQYPLHVPECISLHLKTCLINNYDGFPLEFEFARYIMQNAGVLKNMVISTCPRGTNRLRMGKIKKNLTLCTKLSSTCILSFK